MDTVQSVWDAVGWLLLGVPLLVLIIFIVANWKTISHGTGRGSGEGPGSYGQPGSM